MKLNSSFEVMQYSFLFFSSCFFFFFFFFNSPMPFWNLRYILLIFLIYFRVDIQHMTRENMLISIHEVSIVHKQFILTDRAGKRLNTRKEKSLEYSMEHRFIPIKDLLVLEKLIKHRGTVWWTLIIFFSCKFCLDASM